MKGPISKEQVSVALRSVGATWAYTDTKTIGANERTAAYHVHPNAADPQQSHVLTFGTLESILAWCADVRDDTEQAC